MRVPLYLSWLVLTALSIPSVQCASTSSRTATPARDAGDGGPTGPIGPLDYCHACQLVKDAPKVALPASSELSGIAASAQHTGVYYVHNDSGDSPRFFAIDDQGALRGTYRVTGAKARDWEDLAVGPCPEGSCVFLSDAGDNDSVRTDYVLYRVPEPAELDIGTADVASVAIPFAYPDGSHDCEALLVHPQTGRVVAVTKEKNGPSGVYVFPATLEAGVKVTLERAGQITIPEASPLVTSGDVNPLGRGVLLRTYDRAFYFAGEPGQSTEEMLRSKPCLVPAATEAQGEAIAWQRSGAGWVTVSEGAASLDTVRCAPQ